jgi:hypothetical protein
LIVGDDEALVNFGVSLASVAAEPSNSGVPIWMDPSTSEVNRTLRLDGATLVSDRFQMGASLMMISHQIKTTASSDTTTGFGDVRLSAGYEFLPLWTYSPWRPKGFLFSVLTIPTGRSIYESQAPVATDVTGNGFYSLAVGSLLIKRWDIWDIFLIPEIHYSLNRTFQNYGETFQVEPGIGGSVGVGGGFSIWDGDLRLGLRVQPKWDQSRKITSVRQPANGNSWMSNNDVGLDVTYLLSSNDTVMISYTDQTLLGPASNINLNRVVAVNFQHRWER